MPNQWLHGKVMYKLKSCARLAAWLACGERQTLAQCSHPRGPLLGRVAARAPSLAPTFPDFVEEFRMQ